MTVKDVSTILEERDTLVQHRISHNGLQATSSLLVVYLLAAHDIRLAIGAALRGIVLSRNPEAIPVISVIVPPRLDALPRETQSLA